MTEYEKLERKYRISAELYKQSIDDYYKYSFAINNPDFNKEKGEEAHSRVTDFFEEIIDIAGLENKMKEPHKIFSTTLSETIIPKTALLTKGSELEINIGLFRDFYVIWDIQYCDHIKDMKDDFWLLLFEFASLGKFKFQEEKRDLNSIRKKHKHLFNRRGNFYKLMRNYFLTQTEYQRTRKLGMIGVEWDNKTDLKELIPKFIRAIGILNKLNIMLYKKAIKNTTGNNVYSS